jgi:hypothetical protein
MRPYGNDGNNFSAAGCARGWRTLTQAERLRIIGDGRFVVLDVQEPGAAQHCFAAFPVWRCSSDG